MLSRHPLADLHLLSSNRSRCAAVNKLGAEEDVVSAADPPPPLAGVLVVGANSCPTNSVTSFLGTTAWPLVPCIAALVPILCDTLVLRGATDLALQADAQLLVIQDRHTPGDPADNTEHTDRMTALG